MKSNASDLPQPDQDIRCHASPALPLSACLQSRSQPIASAGEAFDLDSPGGKLAVSVQVDDEGQPTYRVTNGDKLIVADSCLGFDLKDGDPLTKGFRVVDTRRSNHDETWQPVYGERSEIRDHYKQLDIDLADSQAPPRCVTLCFRAYDEGIAFCYDFPKQDGLGKFMIAGERTQFAFPEDFGCWPVYSAQGVYSHAKLSKVKPNCERPLVVQQADDVYVAVGEARLVDFARMRLQPDSSASNTLKAHLAGEVKCSAPMTTPWRFVMVGDSPGKLLEQNYLLQNLNDPCAIADTSWIKPGKVIREVTLTTVGGKACVDFAVRNGLQYVEYDAGWYGHEYDDASDATTVTVDPKRSPGPLDLQEVIRYAGERGIGIIVYVNRRALEKQLDEVLPLLRKWGIKGVKYGFVNVGSQQWTTWLHDAVRKAADHQLMVDIHDEYRPTGYERTYPNLMTQEGIGGDETSPSNEQTLTIAFTRMLCEPVTTPSATTMAGSTRRQPRLPTCQGGLPLQSPAIRVLVRSAEQFAQQERWCRRAAWQHRRRAGTGVLQVRAHRLGRNPRDPRADRPICGDCPT